MLFSEYVLEYSGGVLDVTVAKFVAIVIVDYLKAVYVKYKYTEGSKVLLDSLVLNLYLIKLGCLVTKLG